MAAAFTCVFTSRHGDPVCCPRFTVYWITSGLEQSSPKKAKAQLGPEVRPDPSALDPGESSRSDATESLSSMSSEQSGLICSSRAPASAPSLPDRNAASEGLSSLPPAERSPPPSMGPESELLAFTPQTAEREEEEENHIERKKTNWICEENTDRDPGVAVGVFVAIPALTAQCLLCVTHRLQGNSSFLNSSVL